VWTICPARSAVASTLAAWASVRIRLCVFVPVSAMCLRCLPANPSSASEILGAGNSLKVGGIAAAAVWAASTASASQRIVAAVVNFAALRNGAVSNFEGSYVGRYVPFPPAAPAESAIPSRSHAAEPRPTGIGTTCPVDFCG